MYVLMGTEGEKVGLEERDGRMNYLTPNNKQPGCILLPREGLTGGHRGGLKLASTRS